MTTYNRILISVLFVGSASLSAMQQSSQTLENSRKRAAEPSSAPSVEKRIVREGDDDAPLAQPSNNVLEDNETPLQKAVRAANEDEVATLIRAGASVTSKNKDGIAPLHIAATLHFTQSNAGFRIAQHLIKAGASIDDETLIGSTPLHFAAEHGSFACARLFLEKGASVNQLNKRHLTPLYYACHRGHSALVELLLYYNADKKMLIPKFDESLKIAENARIGKLLSLQFNGPSRFQPYAEALLHQYLATGRIAESAKMLASNNMINCCSYPIHTAVRTCQINSVKFLIDNGARLDVTDYRGEIPLHTALRKNDPEIAELLIETIIKRNQKELLDKKNNGGQTPLMIAATISLPSTEPIINRLLDLGVDRTGYMESLPEFMRAIVASSQPSDNQS